MRKVHPAQPLSPCYRSPHLTSTWRSTGRWIGSIHPSVCRSPVALSSVFFRPTGGVSSPRPERSAARHESEGTDLSRLSIGTNQLLSQLILIEGKRRILFHNFMIVCRLFVYFNSLYSPLLGRVRFECLVCWILQVRQK